MCVSVCVCGEYVGLTERRARAVYRKRHLLLFIRINITPFTFLTEVLYDGPAA